MILRLIPSLILALLVSGCDGALDRPIGLAPHGQAVRTNIATHVINPTPPNRRPVAGAQGLVLAIERLRNDEVKPPTNISTAGSSED